MATWLLAYIISLTNIDDIIIGGDFNLVLDIDLDKKGGLAKTHTKAVKVIKDHMAELDLVDVWRLLNPDGRRYSWRRQKPEIHCRLDFCLVSQSLTCNVTNSGILAVFKTDHSLITIKLALHSNPRGPGFWKLNTSLLEEDGYVKQIKTTIKAVQEEYQEDNTINAALTWEMIKLKVREQSMMYEKTKQTNMSRIEEELEKTINWLQKEIDRSSRDEPGKQEMHRELEKKQRELEQIIEHKTKGAILRSKCRWYNEGEKNTKYFLNLEKRHYKNGVISQLKIDDDKFVTSDKEILNACGSFYKNIFVFNVVIARKLKTSSFLRRIKTC